MVAVSEECQREMEAEPARAALAAGVPVPWRPRPVHECTEVTERAPTKLDRI